MTSKLPISQIMYGNIIVPLQELIRISVSGMVVVIPLGLLKSLMTT